MKDIHFKMFYFRKDILWRLQFVLLRETAEIQVWLTFWQCDTSGDVMAGNSRTSHLVQYYSGREKEKQSTVLTADTGGEDTDTPMFAGIESLNNI